MRDDEAGPVLHEDFERLLNELFGFRIERGGRLVENENRRVLEERARDGHALPLPHGQARASLSHDRVVLVGEVFDEPVRVRGFGRRNDPLHRNVQPPVGDVVPDRVVEEHRLLRDEADLLAQGFERDRTDLVAVEQNAAGGGVVKARQEVCDRGLAGARRADERNSLAPQDRHVDAVQDLLVVVGEIHVFEPDLSRKRREWHRPGKIPNLALPIHHAEDPLRRGDRLLDLRVDRVHPA